MRDVRLEFDGVWKKFARGQRAGSLRDAIPALARRMLGRATDDDLRAGEFYSLKDVGFQVSAGECVGIIGHNGAGKSTLLKCASRILRPNRGRVAVRGRVSALIEVGAGFHPDLTGRENVFLNGTILGMRRREILDRFDAIVEFSGLKEFIDTPVKRYSSGMHARLGFSVAAFMDPEVLLIDEVLSVGDASFGRKCERKIKSIVEGDTAVLFVSHNLSAVRMICDRVVVLEAGRMMFDGPPVEAIHTYHELLARDENDGQSHPAIRSLKLTLGDEEGSPASEARPGAELAIDVAMTVDQDIRQCSVGFFIRDEEDSEVYACGLDALEGETIDLRAGETLQARFRFVANLLPGAYWIGTFVKGRPAGEPHAWPIDLNHAPNRAQLVVTGASDAKGKANLFATCQSTVAPAPSRRSSTTLATESI